MRFRGFSLPLALFGFAALAACSGHNGLSGSQMLPASSQRGNETSPAARVDSFTLTFSAPLFIGTPSSIKVSATAYDALGNVITGSYSPAIGVVDNDRSGQTSLSGTSIASPAQTLTLTYKGNGDAFTITGSVGLTHHVYHLQTLLPRETPLATTGTFPVQIRFGADGNLWSVVDEYPSAITVARITPAGTVTLFSDPDPSHWFTTWTRQVIAQGRDGAMWFSWGVGSNVGMDRVDTSGNITSYPLPTTIGDAVASIAKGPGAAIWFTTANSAGANYDVVTISSTGKFKTIAAKLPSTPYNLVEGPDGNMWFTDGTNVDRLTPTGTLTSFTLAGVPTGNRPLWFVVGPDGKFWAPYPFGNNELVKFDTSGAVVSTKQFTTAVPDIYDVVSDASGVYIADFNGNGVMRIAPNASNLEFFAYLPNSLPNSVAVGPDKRVYFVDTTPGVLGNTGGLASVAESIW